MFGGVGVLKEEKLNQYIIITACGYDLMNNMFTRLSYLLQCIMSHVIALTLFQAPVYSIQQERKIHMYLLDRYPN